VPTKELDLAAGVREAVVAVEEEVVEEVEEDVEAVREVDGGDGGESVGAAGLVLVLALAERNRKHMAAGDLLRVSDGVVGMGEGFGAAEGSGSGGAMGSRVERSKSTSMMWPLSWIITFSGFRSRYTIPMLCRYSSASTSSAA
jgi:hypothetical protein